MEVIILKSIGKYSTGDVVKVKLGYFKNYLLNRGFALVANKANLEVFETIRKQKLQEELLRKESAQKIKDIIDGKVFSIFREASQDGVLYVKVSSKDIVSSIITYLESNFFDALVDVDIVQIFKSSDLKLPYLIKSSGIHTLSMSLCGCISCNFKIQIARNEVEMNKASNL